MSGRISGVAVRNLVGMRSTSDPRRYIDISEWLTNKFANVTPRTVRDFVPARGVGPLATRTTATHAGTRWQSTRVPLGAAGIHRRARARTVAGPVLRVCRHARRCRDSSWTLHYYTGTDAKGVPQFSSSERDAAAVDLDATSAGVQAAEMHDIVDQMSVAWVEPLKKWVMFYGGGMINLPDASSCPTAACWSSSRAPNARTS